MFRIKCCSCFAFFLVFLGVCVFAALRIWLVLRLPCFVCIRDVAGAARHGDGWRRNVRGRSGRYRGRGRRGVGGRGGAGDASL